MQNAGQRRQLRLFFGLFQYAFQRGIVNGLGFLIQLVACGGQLGIDSTTVIGAQNSRKQVAVFEPGDQARGCTRAQGGGAGELSHAHMPPILPIQGVQ